MISNVGVGELLLILLISILVAGPKRTVEIARKLGRMSRELRDLSKEFIGALQTEFGGAEQSAHTIETGLRRAASEIEGAMLGATSARPTSQELPTGRPAPPEQERTGAEERPSPALEHEREVK